MYLVVLLHTSHFFLAVHIKRKTYNLNLYWLLLHNSHFVFRTSFDGRCPSLGHSALSGLATLRVNFVCSLNLYSAVHFIIRILYFVLFLLPALTSGAIENTRVIKINFRENRSVFGCYFLLRTSYFALTLYWLLTSYFAFRISHLLCIGCLLPTSHFTFPPSNDLASIKQSHQPVCLFCHVFIVGNHHNGCPFIFIKL